ncbi:MAG: polymer-forming cytoskeletal protein [Planctomycetes bacterium]|nr:polymer-forming cytoskeletal protein [Planctomycetota bacterium]
MSKSAGRRSLLCPRCDAPIDVSASTKSVPCPGCHRNIRTEDEVVNDYQARVEYYNEGHVEVAKKGIIIAEVRVRNLTIKGEVKGPVRARESVQIAKGGRLYGDVVAPTLSVEEGAVLVGRVEVGPKRAAPLDSPALDAVPQAG